MREKLRRLLVSDKFQTRFALIVGIGWSVGMIVVTLMVISNHG